MLVIFARGTYVFLYICITIIILTNTYVQIYHCFFLPVFQLFIDIFIDMFNLMTFGNFVFGTFSMSFEIR